MSPQEKPDSISRRHWIAGGLASVVLARRASAATPPAPLQAPGLYRTRLGSFQLTALYDGIWPIKIDDSFIRNASIAEVDAALTAAFLPPDILPITFTALTGMRDRAIASVSLRHVDLAAGPSGTG